MGRGGRVRDGGAGIAKVASHRHDLNAVDHTISVRPLLIGRCAFDLKRHNCAARALLFHGQRMLGMRGQTWIEHTRNTRMFFEPLGKRKGGSAMGFHAN